VAFADPQTRRRRWSIGAFVAVAADHERVVAVQVAEHDQDAHGQRG
jgi:hypothetical protein